MDTVEKFNWAWKYRVSNAEAWQQFDCTECLQLEFFYQFNLKSHKTNFIKVQIITGIVFMNDYTYYDNSEKLIGEVQRCQDNIRSRPNASRRHDPIQFDART